MDELLLGIPFEYITALTIDGAHWFEVVDLQRVGAAGGPVLQFRTRHAGRDFPQGLAFNPTNTVVVVRQAAVCGVVALEKAS